MDRISLRRLVCVVCGEPIAERGRIDRMYCSGGCRTLAWKNKRLGLRSATGLKQGEACAPAVSFPAYAPHGALVQLAQRLESERLAAQRELASAKNCIAELQKVRQDGDGALLPQCGEVQAVDYGQELASVTARLSEMEKILMIAQGENASLKRLLQEARERYEEMQAQLAAAQTEQIIAKEQALFAESRAHLAESRAQAAEERADRAEAQFLAQEQIREIERQQMTDLQSRTVTAEAERTEALQRAEAGQQRAQATAEALAHMRAHYAVKALEASLSVSSTEGAEIALAWIETRRKLLHRIAANVARDAQWAVMEGETDCKTIATQALDWTRSRVLSQLAEPNSEEFRALFQDHRALLFQLADIVTASISAGASVRAELPAARRTCLQLAQEVLQQFNTTAGQTSGALSDTSTAAATQRLLLLDFCQAAVARVRFSTSTKRALTALEVTTGSVADIGWRHFDETAMVNRWAVANRATLARLATAVLAAL